MALAGGDGTSSTKAPKRKPASGFATILASMSAGTEATAAAKPAASTTTTRLTPFTPEPEPVEEAEQPQLGGLVGGVLGDKLFSGEASKSAVGGILGSGSVSESLRNASATYKAPEEEKGIERPGKPKARKSYEMTWEDYQNLPDSERAAVDFNTMLVEAREKDLNADYEEHPQLKATYEAAVENMFGEDGGSATYAPETMAVLNQIDYKPIEGVKGDDLDDFLGLKVAITDKDLDRLDVNPENLLQKMSGAEPAVLEVKQQLVSGTAALEASLAKGNEMLQNFQSSAAEARNDDVGFFGGTRNEVERAPGFGDDPISQDFQAAYELLASTADDATRASIQGWLENEGLEKDFMRFTETKLTTSERHGLPLGGDSEIEYRSPEEFRVLLGLDEGD